MAVYESCRSITATAGESLTAGIYKFGIYDSSGNIVVQTTAQGAVAGIVGMNVASGGTFPLVVPDGGRAKVIAGATVAAGAKVATDTAGKAITWVDAAGNNAVGHAVQSAVSGDVFAIQFSLVDIGGGS